MELPNGLVIKTLRLNDDLHKINDEILFLETSEETKTMSTAELYTAELVQITEILKLGFGQIDHSLAKHVKKLRTVPDGKILSREFYTVCYTPFKKSPPFPIESLVGRFS